MSNSRRLRLRESAGQLQAVEQIGPRHQIHLQNLWRELQWTFRRAYTYQVHGNKQQQQKSAFAASQPRRGTHQNKWSTRTATPSRRGYPTVAAVHVRATAVRRINAHAAKTCLLLYIEYHKKPPNTVASVVTQSAGAIATGMAITIVPVY